MDPNELQSQLVGIQYSQNMDGVFERQHQAYSDIEMTGVDGDVNEQENETQTLCPCPLVMMINKLDAALCGHTNYLYDTYMQTLRN